MQGTGQTVVRGGYGLFNYHDPQGRRRNDDLPAGSRLDDGQRNVLLSDIPSIVPAAARIALTAIDPNDEKNPRTQSWSLTRPAPPAVEHDGRELATWAARAISCCNAGLANINIVPFGAMLSEPERGPGPATVRSSCTAASTCSTTRCTRTTTRGRTW